MAKPNEDVTKLTKDLDDAALAELNDSVQTEIKSRRPRITLDMIKQGMTKEEDALVRSALLDAAKDLRW